MEKSCQFFKEKTLKDLHKAGRAIALVVKPEEMGVAQDFCTSLARCRIVMNSLKPESKHDDWLLLVEGRKAGKLFTTQLDAEIDQKA